MTGGTLHKTTPGGAPEKPFLTHIITTNGCGNHMLWDILTETSRKRATDRVDSFIQALVLARRNPDAPFPLGRYDGLKAIEVVVEHYRILGMEPGDDPLDQARAAEWMRKAIHTEQGQRPFLLHGTALIHSIEHRLADGSLARWTIEDRNEAWSILEELLSFCGYGIRRVGVVRHPIDVYLSRKERYSSHFNGRLALRYIHEFFELVEREKISNGMPVARYEDLCSGDEAALETFLKGAGLTPEDAAKVNSSIMHKGEIAKWRRRPSEETEPLAQWFADGMGYFGYEYRKCGPVRRWLGLLPIGLRKLKVEISTINKVIRGDRVSAGAFVRHQRSLPARLYFRIVISYPPSRRKIDRWYEANNLNNPIRPLKDVILK